MGPHPYKIMTQSTGDCIIVNIQMKVRKETETFVSRRPKLSEMFSFEEKKVEVTLRFSCGWIIFNNGHNFPFENGQPNNPKF